MRQKYSYLIVLIMSFAFLLVTNSVSAAELVFKVVPNPLADDSATIVEVRLDPQTKNLNVVEGVIKFQGEAAEKLSVGIETGGSALTLWTSAPQYSSAEKALRFAGGVPDGFNQESLLLRLRLVSPSAGVASISWIGGMAYLNDGQGTKENIFAKSITISFSPSDSVPPSSEPLDKAAPNFQYVDIGRDASVYDGKYFVSFSATDDRSGVARYTVKEGDEISEVNDGAYVFKDQNRRQSLIITAYDQAGNYRVTEVPARTPRLLYVIILLLVGGVILFILFHVFRKKNKK
jgi:hypothetical protein